MERLGINGLERARWATIRASGAILDGWNLDEHYELASGLHSRVFYQLNPVWTRLEHRRRMAHLLLMKMRSAGIHIRKISVLLGPAMGAVPLIYALQSFAELSKTRAVFAEHANDGAYVIGGGYRIGPDDQVFVVDDIGTTFGTIRKTIDAAHQACKPHGWEALVIGFGVLIERACPDRIAPGILAPALKYVCGLKSPANARVYMSSQCPDCASLVKLVPHKAKDTKNLELPFQEYLSSDLYHKE